MRQSDSNTATTSNTPEPGSPGPFSGVDLNDDASRSNDSKQSDIIIYKDLKGAATAPQIGLGGYFLDEHLYVSLFEALLNRCVSNQSYKKMEEALHHEKKSKVLASFISLLLCTYRIHHLAHFKILRTVIVVGADCNLTSLENTKFIR